MKTLNEWFISAPWGKIALVSWGNSAGEPVLLVHGRQDSIATFIPLLKMVPEKYYYVGFDLPGHGRSDPFPVGVILPRFLFVTALDMVIQHLGWKKFVYIAHSMGSEIGLFYDAIFPHRVKKFVHLDVNPALQYNRERPIEEFFQNYYEQYYDNYKYYTENDRVYTKRKALDAVMNARDMTEEEAEIILSRSLTEIGDDLYRLSWDVRLKIQAPMILPDDFYLKIFSRNSPPTLFIQANPGVYMKLPSREATKRLIKGMMENSKDFDLITVQGTHDVHFTNPERVAGYIINFLEKDFSIKSKL